MRILLFVLYLVLPLSSIVHGGTPTGAVNEHDASLRELEAVINGDDGGPLTAVQRQSVLTQMHQDTSTVKQKVTEARETNVQWEKDIQRSIQVEKGFDMALAEIATIREGLQSAHDTAVVQRKTIAEQKKVIVQQAQGMANLRGKMSKIAASAAAANNAAEPHGFGLITRKVMKIPVIGGIMGLAAYVD